MINRRIFLSGLGLITIGQILPGCSSSGDHLQVLILRGPIPPQLINRFRQQAEGDWTFQSIAQIKTAFERLQQGREGTSKSSWWDRLLGRSKVPTAIADLSSLGNYWLVEAIRQQLIQPLDLSQAEGWQQIPAAWQEVVKRNRAGQRAATGEIWGAPYRGGCTLIAYRRDKLKGREPKDWSDLWREDIKRKISIVDQPREVIGLTLKSLGHSYNSVDLRAIANLNSQLQKLQEQILYYSSNRYLQPLLLGDTWLAVGWSNDILPLLKNNPDLGVVMPASGTSLWCDLWVRPTRPALVQHLSPDLRSWIDYCWQPAIAEQLARSTRSIAPTLLKNPPDQGSGNVADRFLLSADPTVLARSEFLEPLASEAIQQYQTLWQAVRNRSSPS